MKHKVKHDDGFYSVLNSDLQLIESGLFDSLGLNIENDLDLTLWIELEHELFLEFGRYHET